jgi:hypothetical protein
MGPVNALPFAQGTLAWGPDDLRRSPYGAEPR